MRILYLCADPGVPVLGRKGCSTHVREVSRALVRAGHEVLIACANRGADAQSSGGLDIREIPPLKMRALGFDLRHVLYNYRFNQALDRIVAQYKPEAIYERFSLYSFAGKRLVRRLGIPRLLEINAFLSTEQRDRLHFPRMARWADLSVVKEADHVVVVSEPLREVVADLGIDRANIHKMPMSADIHHFTPDKSGREVRDRFGLDGKFVIGYVGTLTGWHGINLLYDVARRLEESIDDFCFFLVGGDDTKVAQHREKVERHKLSRRFVYAGSVPYERVPEHVRAMDVTIVPDTTYWSSPTKLFEYQAAGVPTVAPRYAAIMEAMQEGKEGLFFDTKDTEQFADRLHYLFAHPKERIRLGANARKRVVGHHSIDQQVNNLTEILEAMRNEPNRARVEAGAS